MQKIEINIMRYTTSYTNSLNLFWILFFGFSLPLVLLPELNHRYILTHTSIYLSVYFIILLYVAYLFSIHFIYQIEIVDKQVIKSYLLKREKEIVTMNKIKSVIISIPDFRDPPAVRIVYFNSLNEEKRIWFICMDMGDLKKLYQFFVENELTIEVVPKEKLNKLMN
ncbi:hypothetical protein [Flavobacterium sp. FlaQc-48]|uniref:hypothetical protein n=1 Tax=Flavobacterium sp. FlaQc-48 TaxID=3374181 RepID=UPI003758085C